MSKSFKKEFLSFCENQDLEVNKNQITVIRNKKNLGLAGSINKGLDKISRIHDSFDDAALSK